MICNPTHLLSADTTTLKNTLDFRQCYMWEPPWQSCQKSNITNLSSQPHGVHIKTLVTNPHFQREMSNFKLLNSLRISFSAHFNFLAGIIILLQIIP